MYVATVTILALLLWPRIAIGETRSEVWPDVNFYHKIDETFRLHAMGAFVKGRDVDYSDGQFGAHLDIGFAPILRKRLLPDSNLYKYLWFRVGYRYASTFSSSDPFEEHRIVVEQTGRFYLPAGFMLVDRNRGDLRFINGVYSSRYRNRLRLERQVEVFDRGLLPYLSAELFYDTRFDAVNRYRYAAGVEIPIRTFILDLYYLRQEDTRSEPAHSNVVGISLSFYF